MTFALLTAAAPALAAGPFDGTWKADIKASQPSKKPNTLMIRDGIYTCSCTPPITVPADGAFHAVTGHPYFDEISVTIVDASTMRNARRKDGKLMGTATMHLAADGLTAKTTYEDLSATNGVPVTGSAVEERAAPAPAGSHALSGSWRATNIGESSDSGLLFTIVTKGDVVHYSTPTGAQFSATIGGPAAAVTGDAGWTSAAVTRLGPNILAETDGLKGKPVDTMVMTVSPDGKKITLQMTDLVSGKVGTYVAMKQ